MELAARAGLGADVGYLNLGGEKARLGQGQTWAVVCRAKTGATPGLGQGASRGWGWGWGQDYMLGLVNAGQVTNDSSSSDLF